MEIVLAALVAAGVAVAVVMLVQRPRAVGAAVSRAAADGGAREPHPGDGHAGTRRGSARAGGA